MINYPGSLKLPGFIVFKVKHIFILLGLIYCCYYHAYSQQPPNKVLVAAHRGDWRYAPENSMQGFRNCIKMGVDIAELDVRKTKDGQLVVIHDKTLDRTTTGKGAVKNYTLQELRQLFLLNGYGTPTRQHMATLEEVMLLVKGKMMVMIDKSAEYLPEIYQVLKKTGTFNEAIIFQRTQQPIDSIRLEYGPLLPQIKYIVSINEKGIEPGTLAYYQQQQDQLQPYGFDITFSLDNSPVFPIVNQVKKSSHVWATTLWPEVCAGHDDELAMEHPDDTWGWIINQGADIICTDRPSELIGYLKSKGLHR